MTDNFDMNDDFERQLRSLRPAAPSDADLVAAAYEAGRRDGQAQSAQQNRPRPVLRLAAAAVLGLVGGVAVTAALLPVGSTAPTQMATTNLTNVPVPSAPVVDQAGAETTQPHVGVSPEVAAAQTSPLPLRRAVPGSYLDLRDRLLTAPTPQSVALTRPAAVSGGGAATPLSVRDVAEAQAQLFNF